MPEPTSPAPAPRSSPGRTAALIGGVLTGFVAFAVLAAGAVLLWGNSHKDRDGYLATGSDRYHTRTYALATQNLDVHTDAPNWLVDSSDFGRIRLRAESHAGKPVFVGIARSRDVATYLRGTAHATLTDVDYSPFEASYRTHGGTRPAGRPGEQRFWVANAEGPGRQTLKWKVRDGDWSVVVMNADGSANVDTGVSAGAQAPWLATAGWGSLGVGLLLVALAGGLIVAGARGPRPPRAPLHATPAPAAA